jgi:hypothetical protein
MKKISGLIIIAVSIGTICSPSCAKKSSGHTTLPPPQPCSTPSACIVNTWYIQQWQANYNGSVITTYTRGGNSNLSDDDSTEWVFGNGNKWTGYASPSVIFDAGTWKISPDSITVVISGSIQDTFSIIKLTASVLSINIPFDHNYPNAGWVVVAEQSGLDTSKLNAFMATFSPSQ